MLKDIYVIDNVFPYPEEVVKWANVQRFGENNTHKFDDERRTYWVGKRTFPLHKISPDHGQKANLLIDDIFNSCFEGSYSNFTYNYEWEGNFFFHRLDKTCVFENSWMHIDPKCIYAGVVYLNQDPPLNSGTMIYTEEDKVTYVDNVFNRLVLYKSKFKHSAMSGFGEEENSRLTFTMFFSKINVSIKSEDAVPSLA
jgi:hypothetical protein